jgi:hypothetical protein
VNGTGAADLELRSAEYRQQGLRTQLFLRLAQRQALAPLPGKVLSLRIPIAVHLVGRSTPEQRTLEWSVQDGAEKIFVIDLTGVPHAVEVDPEFDVFRRLSQREVPPSFARAYGAGKTVVLLPASASPDMRDAYGRLAETIEKNRSGLQTEIRSDSEISSLDSFGPGVAVWILGWENRFAPSLAQELKQQDVSWTGNSVEVNGKSFTRQTHAFAFVSESASIDEQTRILVAMDSPLASEAASVLGAKLPHYGKFGYAVFEIIPQGAQGSRVGVQIRSNGQWLTLYSPLSRDVLGPDGRSHSGSRSRLAPRSALSANIP